VTSLGGTIAVNIWFDWANYAKKSLNHVYQTPTNILAQELSKHEPLCKFK
jgi:hypothetical protein